jgi:hypothetical protein
MEKWIDIKGYEGLYQVSNYGNVRSIDRIVNAAYNAKKRLKGRVLVKTLSGSGYYKAILSKLGKSRNEEIHRLVAYHFLGPKQDERFVVDHIDNNKLNNHIDNLQYISQRQNSSKNKFGTSKYTGVYWNKTEKKWHVRIRVNGKKEHLGYFKCELAAAKAYQDRLKQLGE